jgi:hypothetical protein
MNIHTFLKRQKSFKIESSSGPVSAWTWIVLVALFVLFASIAFHAFFLAGAESISVDASATASAVSPETIDRNALQTILADHDSRLADLSSERAAALASPDPSK